MYPKNHSTHRGFTVVRDTSAYGASKLHGLKDTVIYTTYSAYIKQSNAFKTACAERNIEVRVLNE